MSILEQDLEKLFLNNTDFDVLSSAMDIFCPFDAVGMDNQEIRHGYFIRYILDPARPHGFGTECLRGFMWAAADALQASPEGLLKPLDVHLMDLDDAIVSRVLSVFCEPLSTRCSPVFEVCGLAGELPPVGKRR